MKRRDFHRLLIGTTATHLLGRAVVSAFAPTTTVIPLGEEHLQEAVALLTKQYLATRQSEPALPSVADVAVRMAEIRAERGLPPSDEPDGVLPVLPLLRRPSHPAVAAFKDGQLVGYLRSVLELDTPIRSASTGMQNLAVDPIDGAQTYREMYAAVAQQWLAERCSVHLVKVFAADRQAIDTWFSLGFGQVSVQVFRDANYRHEKATGIEVVPARAEHVEVLLRLQSGQRRYESEAPMFVPNESTTSDSAKSRRQDIEGLLNDPHRRCWLAFQNGTPAAMMSLRPAAGSGLSPLLQMTRMTFVEDASTGEAARDPNVRGALLDTALTWARGQRYERCYAGFHAADTLASRFWFSAGFRPVAYWLMRNLDPKQAR